MTTVRPGVLPLLEHVEQPHLAARIERVGRLVHEQHLGLHRQHTRDGHTLLLAAGERVGRTVEQLLDPQPLGDLCHAAPYLVLGESKLQGPEGELVKRGRTEELDVCVLEDKPDIRAELAPELRFIQRVLGQCVTEGRDGSCRGEDQTIEHLEQRGLAAAVGADQSDLLAGLDRQVDAVEREDAGTILVADAGKRELRAHRGISTRSAPKSTAQAARLAASQSQSRAPARSRTSEGIAPLKPRASIAS